MRSARNSSVIIVVALLCFLVWWLYFKGNRPAQQPLPSPSFPVTNTLPQQEAAANDMTNPSSKPEDMDWSWTNQVPVEKRAWMIDRVKKMIALTSMVNAPIVFYGEVIDQFGQPVDGVKVIASYNTWNVPDLIQQSPGRQTAHFSSTADGVFVVKGIRGASMTIALEKEGYELAPHSELSFAFDPTARNPHVPNPTNPVVYHMWKRTGAAELKGFYNRGMIPTDGQSIWITGDSNKWSRTELSHAMLKLTVNRERRVVTSGDKSPYRWEFEINMPGGGIQKTKDDFLYLAPDADYSHNLSVVHQADEVSWIWEQRIAFYFKTNNGKYGHGEVFISNWQNQDEAWCELSLTWNPDGSRNLEHKPE